MTEEVTAYRYLIPLEEVEGVERPAYDLSTQGDVVFTKYNPTTLEVVQTKSTPHFHKDSVNVTSEKVPLEDYVDDVSKHTETESEEDEEEDEVEEEETEEEDEEDEASEWRVDENDEEDNGGE